MRYFVIKPEAPGGLGERTAISSRNPIVVERLHIEFDDWLGSALLTSHPCFFVTEAARGAIETEGLSGVDFDEMEVTISEQYLGRRGSNPLPLFFWAKIIGAAGEDDFGIASGQGLVISEDALHLLQSLGFGRLPPRIAPYAP